MSLENFPPPPPSPAEGSRRIKVDITHDPMDPWCLVGIKQFLVALSVYNDQHPRSRLIPAVRLMPYCLNPYLTPVPIPRREHRSIIFGEEEYLLRQLPRWVGKMRDLGYEPADDSSAWAASSHATQRLLSYCLLIHPERQLGLAMDIYEQYHVGGRHCSDLHMLAELGRRHGVFGSTQEALEWLSGTELDKEVQRAYLTAKRLGVSGVPFFVFQDKWAASGAMGVDRFVQLLHDISHREGLGSATPSPTSTAASPTDAERSHSHAHQLPKTLQVLPSVVSVSGASPRSPRSPVSPMSPMSVDGPGSKGVSCERDTCEA